MSRYKEPIRTFNQADTLFDFCCIVVVTTPKKKINMGSIRHHGKGMQFPREHARPTKSVPIKDHFDSVKPSSAWLVVMCHATPSKSWMLYPFTKEVEPTQILRACTGNDRGQVWQSPRPCRPSHQTHQGEMAMFPHGPRPFKTGE